MLLVRSVDLGSALSIALQLGLLVCLRAGAILPLHKLELGELQLDISALPLTL